MQMSGLNNSESLYIILSSALMQKNLKQQQKKNDQNKLINTQNAQEAPVCAWLFPLCGTKVFLLLNMSRFLTISE